MKIAMFCRKKMGSMAALVTALAIALPLSPVYANYTPSTDSAPVDPSVITASAYYDAMSAAEMLGANVVATSSYDVYWRDTTPRLNTFLGIWGTDVNENPDPYVQNLFYNYDNYDIGDANSNEGRWTATPYTILNDIMYDTWVEGKSGADLEEVDITIDGVTKHTTASFYYEADLLIGSGDPSDYARQLENYRVTYNEDYDPVFVRYQTSDTMSADTFPSDALAVQCARLQEVAEVMEQVMAETGKTTRYAQSPSEIAQDYERYTEAIYNYTLYNLEQGLLEKKTVAICPTYQGDGTWTISSQSGWVKEYTRDTFYDLADDVLEITADVGSMTITTDELMKQADVIVSFDPRTTEELKNCSYNGIVIDKLPLTTNSMLLDGIDNAIGIPLFVGTAYYDQDVKLNPVGLIAYYVKHFYHIEDEYAIREVLSTMLGEDGANLEYLPAYGNDIWWLIESAGEIIEDEAYSSVSPYRVVASVGGNSDLVVSSAQSQPMQAAADAAVTNVDGAWSAAEEKDSGRGEEALQYVSIAAETGFEIVEATNENDQVIRIYNRDADEQQGTDALPLQPVGASAALHTEPYAQTKALLLALGMEQDFIDNLSDEDLAVYAASEQITGIVSYIKTDEAGNATYVEESVAEEEAAAALNAAESNVRSTAAAVSGTGTVVYEGGETYQNGYIRMYYTVTYMGSGKYQFATDARWLYMPLYRGVDTIGSSAMNCTVESSTRSGYYQYDSYMEVEGDKSYTSPYFLISAGKMKNVVNGNWYGSLAKIQLPMDGGGVGVSRVLSNFKVHYQYQGKVNYPELAGNFNTVASYDHTITYIKPSVSFAVGVGGVSGSIGFDLETGYVIFNLIPDSISYQP